MNAKPVTDSLKREFAWLQGILVVGIVVAAELLNSRCLFLNQTISGN